MAATVKVRLLRNHEHKGLEFPTGAILEMTPERANRLIGMGYAVKHADSSDFEHKPAEAKK